MTSASKSLSNDLLDPHVECNHPYIYFEVQVKKGISIQIQT